ncbi:MAG: protein phosphatase, partial [bacterium]
SDGLGGAAAGEVASAMAVQTVCTELMKTIKSVLSPNDRLKRATEQANDQIWACAQSDNSLRGMGATLTAAFIYDTSVYIAQVGDSRAYIVRGGRVKQVTEDQSWANAVKKAGLEIADVPSNVILQALGTQPKVHVEVTSVDLLNGDVLLMCSDGLSNKIKDLEMREIANSSQDLAENCRQLVDLANKRGGEDNITVILARFEGKSLSIGFEERDLSITSTFKIVTPLDFGEALDESETMSFRVEEPQTVDPMSVTQSALFDGIPTISGLPQLPTILNKASAKEIKSHAEMPVLPTTPLTSDSTSKNKEEKTSATVPLLPTDSSNSASKKNLTTSERAAFRQAETKTDLPVIAPVFDLSKEPIAEPKMEAE